MKRICCWDEEGLFTQVLLCRDMISASSAEVLSAFHHIRFDWVRPTQSHGSEPLQVLGHCPVCHGTARLECYVFIFEITTILMFSRHYFEDPPVTQCLPPATASKPPHPCEEQEAVLNPATTEGPPHLSLQTQGRQMPQDTFARPCTKGQWMPPRTAVTVDKARTGGARAPGPTTTLGQDFW